MDASCFQCTCTQQVAGQGPPALFLAHEKVNLLKPGVGRERRSEATHPTQQAILYKKGANPNWQNTEIANAVGCSDSHVSDTLNRWSPDEMDEDGTVPGQSTISLGSLIFGSVEDVDRDSPAPFSVGFGVVAIGIGLWVWWILVLMNPGEFSGRRSGTRSCSRRSSGCSCSPSGCSSTRGYSIASTLRGDRTESCGRRSHFSSPSSEHPCTRCTGFRVHEMMTSRSSCAMLP